MNCAKVVVFRIDPSSGRLEATGTELKLDNPVCVRFLRVK